MSCIVCGYKHYRKIIYGGYKYLNNKYDIVRCLKCRFMFLNPTPEEGILDEVYKSSAYFNNYYIEGVPTLNYLEGIDYVSAKMLENIRLLKRFKKGGRLLDVGCAGGRFLKIAKNEGYDCVGIEPNSDMAAFVEKELHIPVKNTKIQAGLFKEAEFDIIHLGDIMEHVVNLEESFELFTKWLKRDGLLFIEQPLTYNRSLFNLFLRLNMFVLRQRYSYNPPFHLWEFNPITLRRFLNKHRYTILYNEVFENRAKRLLVYKNPKLKNYISHVLKDTSSFISNLFLFKPLKLGDRAVVVCKKKIPKILLLHPNLDIGGAEVNRLSVLKNINRDKYDITICCLSHKGKIGEEIEKLGFPVYTLGISDDSFNVLATFLLYRFMRRHRFDIVHTCLSNTNLHGRIAAKLAGVPIIISEEQSDYERFNPRLSFIFMRINHLLVQFTDRIICCSENVRHSLIRSESIPIEKIITIYNCIDILDYRPQKTREQMRSQLGLGQDTPVIGYIASLGKRKGHDFFLSVLEVVKQSYPNVKLLLVGKGPLREGLEILVAQKELSDNVMFLGEKRDISDILTAIDVFVSSARQEAFGINLIEAMYMGIPCVAMRVGGIPEVIDHGVNGILISPDDKKEMANAIINLLHDTEKANVLGKNARQKVLRCFTSRGYVARLENLYNNLLAAINERM